MSIYFSLTRCVMMFAELIHLCSSCEPLLHSHSDPRPPHESFHESPYRLSTQKKKRFNS